MQARLKYLFSTILLIGPGLFLTTCEPFASSDSVPPSVVIIHPVDGSYLYEPDTIKVIAVDNDSVALVAFYIDTDVIGTDRVPPFQQFWDVPYWADGERHSIVAHAEDKVGNVNLSTPISVYVSGSAAIWPEPIVPGPDSIFAAKATITFVWYQLRDAVEYELHMASDYGFTELAYSGTTTDTTVTVADLVQGSYYWRVRGRNDLGRGSAWSESQRFYVVTNLSDILIFHEYASNPVLTGASSWNSSGVVNPMVIYDEGIYKMWFAGYLTGSNYIGYATSSDGVSWTEYPASVLGPGNPGEFDERSVKAPKVIKENNVYRMWYSGMSGSGLQQVGLATSEDGVNWTKHPSSPVLTVGNPGEFDSSLIRVGNPINVDGVYYVWYDAGNGVVSTGVGLATSNDGVSWQKYPNNPVLVPDEGLTWESVAIGGGFVLLQSDGSFEMFYNASDGSVKGIGRAWSTDGIAWIRDPFNPIVGPGSNGSWNTGGPSGGTVIRQGSTYKFWFAGRDSYNKWSIGYGTAEPMQ